MMRSVYALVLSVALVPLELMANACTLIDLPEATESSQPGTGGAGGAGEDDCTSDDDCLDPGTDCIIRRCVEGECLYEAADEFVPISNQAVGDCAQVVCNGEGGEKRVDVEDPFDDGKECTADLCADGTPVHQSSVGTTCSTGVCNQQGGCVECNDDPDCANQPANASECQQNICVPPSCSNNVTDGDETDLNCGGSCVPCGATLMCLVNSDCSSLVCDEDALVCNAPSCDDGVTNGDESDQDCGGSTCDGCAPNASCGAPTDCASMVCVGAICQAPTCNDGVFNADETDVDCGGPDCGPCATGKQCQEPRDCSSKVCTNGKCQAPSCSDGIQNGTEKGVDCGGSCVACKGQDPIPVEQPVEP